MAEPIPAKVKRTLWRGDTRSWTHVFTDTETGDPTDITGWVFLSQYREDRNRGTVIATATCTVTDGPNGVMLEVLPAEQSDLLPGQEDPAVKPIVYWDLQSSNAGVIQTWQWANVPVGGDSSDA